MLQNIILGCVLWACDYIRLFSIVIVSVLLSTVLVSVLFSVGIVSVQFI